MNVTCTKCGKKYVIADDKVAGKTSVKIRCKQCQSLISVAVDHPSPAPGAASSPSGVASSPSGVASSPSGVASSPSGVASSPSGVASSPSGVASSPSGVAAAPRAVASAPSGVMPMAAGAPPPPAAARPASTSASAPAPPRQEVAPAWYAMVGGKQEGPFDLRGLQAKVGQGEVSLRTYLWRAGMSDWKRAADVPDVSPIFAGLSAGATATGRTQTSTRTAPRARTGAGQDVAVANETPSPELTRARPEPATAGGVTEAPDPLAALQGLPATQERGAGESTAPQPAAGEQATADPFAQLAPLKAGEAPPPGENTKFFIAKAGVNKRNPPWKIALFVLGLVGVPVAITFLLSSFHVVELPTVTRTTDDGREVQETFFSPGGMSGLRDLLTGEAEQRKQESERARKAKEAAASARAQQAAQEPVVLVPRPANPALAALYGSDELKTRGPKVRKDDGEPAQGPQVNAAGLSQEAAMKVVADKSKAFQQCVETALHRNPNLAVGNILVVLTVGASGAVKSATVEPRKHEASDWAQCMMAAAKRIVFPGSDGETQLELPFKVGVAIGP